MKEFNLFTNWIHGQNVTSELGTYLQEYGCKNVLVVTDKTLYNSGVISSIEESIKKIGISYSVTAEIEGEPTVSFFDSLTGKLPLSDYDAFVAVGGGSVIDVTKGLRVVAKYGKSIKDYGGIDKVPGALESVLIAIPTTSGTGSEVSNGAVFTDEEKQTKFAMVDMKNCPTLALTDPELTKSMPPKITAITGIDALVHAIESYVSKFSNFITETFALDAIELIGNNLEKAIKNGNNIEARGAMQVGSTLAMFSAFNARLGLCHAMAMPLCALYKLPHGQACGMVLPYVLEYNNPQVKTKVQRIFELLGYIESQNPVDDTTFKKLENLVDSIGVSEKLSNLGYEEKHLDVIVEGTLNSFQTTNNPREVTRKGIEEIVAKIK